MEKILNIDNFILEFIRFNIQNNILDKIMPLITKLGDMSILWLIISFIFLINKTYRKYGILIIASLILCIVVCNLIMKPLFARVRPCDANSIMNLLISRPKDFSFPSGHTMSSFAAATIIFSANTKLGVLSLLIATLIGFSRLYLYVHYPSDVLVGLFMGVFLSIFTLYISKLTFINNLLSMHS